MTFMQEDYKDERTTETIHRRAECDESRMLRSEGGTRKRAAMYLAGCLPYCPQVKGRKQSGQQSHPGLPCLQPAQRSANRSGVWLPGRAGKSACSVEGCRSCVFTQKQGGS